MKEKIAKVASLHSEIAKFISEGKTDEAIAKLTEATTEVEDLSTDAENTETESEAIEKKVQAEINKYADLYVSASTFNELLEEFKKASALLATLEPIVKSVPGLASQVETIAKSTNGSNQIDGGAAPIKKTGSVQGELSGFFG